MKNQSHPLINYLSNIPIKNIFLIDGIGALVSALFLGLIITPFADYFGMPKSSLYILAAIPCVFLVYDLICFFFIKKNLALFLKIIAFANLVYCLLSLLLAIYHWASLSLLAWMYIIVEITIILLMVNIEFVAYLINNPPTNESISKQ